MLEAIIIRTKKMLQQTDWVLLVFLLLVLDVKLIVKLAGLVFIYLVRFNVNFRLSWKNSRLPLFYALILLPGIIGSVPYLFSGTAHYWLVFVVGVVFWLVSLLVIHQLQLTIETVPAEKIHNAIRLFLILNIIFSFLNLFVIFGEIGLINPYRYQGLYQKYFIGTGDFIRGITFDTSTTNALINAAGIFYAISMRKFALAICCMIVLLMTGSNFTNLAVLISLAVLFVLKSDRDQKSVIILFPVLLVLFLTNISPQNSKYSLNVVNKVLHKKPRPTETAQEVPVEKRPDSILTPDERKYKLAKIYLDSLGHVRRVAEGVKTNIALTTEIPKPTIPQPNIHAPEFQHRHDTSSGRLQAIQMMQQLQVDTLPAVRSLDMRKANGKVESMKSAFRYLSANPSHTIAGNGIGNFSSKLAFRATGLKIAGGYPARYIYINKDFERNQLSLYLDYFSRDSGLHSAINTPNSVYVQLLSEYGLLGLGIFVCCYLVYFLRRYRYLSYGLPVLVLLTAACFVDYWFEQLSVVIFFELLMLLDSKGFRIMKTTEG